MSILGCRVLWRGNCNAELTWIPLHLRVVSGPLQVVPPAAWLDPHGSSWIQEAMRKLPVLIRLRPRRQSILFTIFPYSKKSQSSPDADGGETDFQIDASSQRKESQRIGSHL